jgi:hypothetical protein
MADMFGRVILYDLKFYGDQRWLYWFKVWIFFMSCITGCNAVVWKELIIQLTNSSKVSQITLFSLVLLQEKFVKLCIGQNCVFLSFFSLNR